MQYLGRFGSCIDSFLLSLPVHTRFFMRKKSFYRYESPLLWVLIGWSVALVAWAMTPEEVVDVFVPAGRHISGSSFAYLIMFLLLLSAGFQVGKRWKKRPMSIRLSLQKIWLDPGFAHQILPAILGVSRVLVLVGSGIAVIQILITIQGGQYSGLLFWETMEVRQEYHQGIVQGVTILKFVSLPGFILATIGEFISKKWRYKKLRRKFRFVQYLALITPIFNIFLGTRLMALFWIIPYIYLRLGLKNHLKRVRFTKVRFILWMIIIAAVTVIIFSEGFYVRHYRRVIEGVVSPKGFVEANELNLPGYAFLEFLSYPFRTVNNCFVIVDHMDSFTFLWRHFRWAYTGFLIEELDPGGLIEGARLKLYHLESRGLGYFSATNSSLPGFMFIDVGWFALFGALTLGFITGWLYKLWLNLYLVGWILTPIILFGLLDSWRTDIIFRSVSMVALVSGALACVYIAKKSSIRGKTARIRLFSRELSS